MKFQTLGGLAACVLSGFLSLVVLVVTSKSQTTIGSKTGGLPSEGLQMSLALAKPDKAGASAFEVAFQNVGQRDILLSLGEMLANGQEQLPTQVRLIVTDVAGNKRELHFSGGRIAGRVDEYRVPLRAGSTYSLKLTLDRFWSPSTNEVVLKLQPGKYRVSAQFEGVGDMPRNEDQQNIGLMHYWKGKAQSNVISFER